jgi:hypothetical protein
MASVETGFGVGGDESTTRRTDHPTIEEGPSANAVYTQNGKLKRNARDRVPFLFLNLAGESAIFQLSEF